MEKTITVSQRDPSFEINGVRYVERPKVNNQRGMAKYTAGIMAIAMMMGGMPSMKTAEKPDVDIVYEFSLIQQKKSNLSRSEREWVVREFNRNFTTI